MRKKRYGTKPSLIVACERDSSNLGHRVDAKSPEQRRKKKVKILSELGSLHKDNAAFFTTAAPATGLQAVCNGPFVWGLPKRVALCTSILYLLNEKTSPPPASSQRDPEIHARRRSRTRKRKKPPTARTSATYIMFIVKLLSYYCYCDDVPVQRRIYGGRGQRFLFQTYTVKCLEWLIVVIWFKHNIKIDDNRFVVNHTWEFLLLFLFLMVCDDPVVQRPIRFNFMNIFISNNKRNNSSPTTFINFKYFRKVYGDRKLIFCPPPILNSLPSKL